MRRELVTRIISRFPTETPVKVSEHWRKRRCVGESEASVEHLDGRVEQEIK